MLPFERICRAWVTAVNERDTDDLMSLLSDDFRWVTYTQNPAGLDAAGTRDFCLGGTVGNFNYTGTIHDSDEILIGTNDITRQGEASKVLNVAKVRMEKCTSFTTCAHQFKINGEVQ